MNKKKLIISIVLIVLLVNLNGCMEITEQDKEGTGTIILTAQQYVDCLETFFDNITNKLVINFTTLDDGDFVIVKDTVYDINYYETFNITSITFNVNESKNGLFGGTLTAAVFAFEGNITDEYSIGDVVKISFHIKHYMFNDTMPLGAGDEKIFYDLEVPEEGWDQDFFVSHLGVVLPQTCITLFSEQKSRKQPSDNLTDQEKIIGKWKFFTGEGTEYNFYPNGTYTKTYNETKFVEKGTYEISNGKLIIREYFTPNYYSEKVYDYWFSRNNNRLTIRLEGSIADEVYDRQ